MRPRAAAQQVFGASCLCSFRFSSSERGTARVRGAGSDVHAAQRNAECVVYLEEHLLPGQ
jgi:hypothetical protein